MLIYRRRKYQALEKTYYKIRIFWKQKYALYKYPYFETKYTYFDNKYEHTSIPVRIAN